MTKQKEPSKMVRLIPKEDRINTAIRMIAKRAFDALEPIETEGLRRERDDDLREGKKMDARVRRELSTKKKQIRFIERCIQAMPTVEKDPWNTLMDCIDCINQIAISGKQQLEIIGIIRTSSDIDKKRAMELAGFIGSAKFLQALAYAAGNGTLEERKEAVWAIAMISEKTRDPNIFKKYGEKLAEWIRHPNAWIRQHAAMALTSIGDRSALPALETALAIEQDEDAKEQLEGAIKALNKKD